MPYTFGDVAPILGPIAARHRTSTPAATVLALLAGAARFEPPVPPSLVRAWTAGLTTTRPELTAITRPAAWSATVNTSRRYLTAANAPEQHDAQRLRIARALTGHILQLTSSPLASSSVSSVVPLPSRSVPSAVAVLAVAGGRMLAEYTPDGRGIDAPLMSVPRLAVTVGLSESTARLRVKSLREAGALRRVGVRKGSAHAYRLGQLPAEVGALAWDHADAIDAVARGDVTNEFASVIGSAGHAYWAYGPLGIRAWLVMLSDALGVDVVGIAPRTVTSLRKEIRTAGIVTGAGLADRLDELARIPGKDGVTPLDAYRAAEAHRRAKAEVRKADVLEARRAKDADWAVKDAVRRAKRPPRTPAAPAEPVSAATATREIKLPDGYRPAEHEAGLRGKLAQRGYEVVEVDLARGVAIARPVEPAF